jgi:hypothetical protein
VDRPVCRIERDQYSLRELPDQTLRSGPLGSGRGQLAQSEPGRLLEVKGHRPFRNFFPAYQLRLLICD